MSLIPGKCLWQRSSVFLLVMEQQVVLVSSFVSLVSSSENVFASNESVCVFQFEFSFPRVCVCLFRVAFFGFGLFLLGKTTFVKRHQSGEFEKKYFPTIGVEVRPMKFHTSRGLICFNCWDTAGQEKFGCLRDGYYIQGQCAIIFFDVTSLDSYKNVPKWYHDVMRVCDRIPIVLVGNKVPCLFSVLRGPLFFFLRESREWISPQPPILFLFHLCLCLPSSLRRNLFFFFFPFNGWNELLRPSFVFIFVFALSFLQVDIVERAVKAKMITFHRKKNIQYYDLSAKSNYNFEKPFLYLARRLSGDNNLTFVASPSLMPPEIHLTAEQMVRLISLFFFSCPPFLFFSFVCCVKGKNVILGCIVVGFFLFLFCCMDPLKS